MKFACVFLLCFASMAAPKAQNTITLKLSKPRVFCSLMTGDTLIIDTSAVKYVRINNVVYKVVVTVTSSLEVSKSPYINTSGVWYNTLGPIIPYNGGYIGQ